MKNKKKNNGPQYVGVYYDCNPIDETFRVVKQFKKRLFYYEKTTINTILTVFHANIFKVWAWGFENMEIIRDGIRFHVQGFKHKGFVEVIYVRGLDLFSIKLIDEQGDKVISVTEEVYIDELVETISDLVERTDDYERIVQETYNY